MECIFKPTGETRGDGRKRYYCVACRRFQPPIWSMHEAERIHRQCVCRGPGTRLKRLFAQVGIERAWLWMFPAPKTGCMPCEKRAGAMDKAFYVAKDNFDGNGFAFYKRWWPRLTSQRSLARHPESPEPSVNRSQQS